MSAWRGAFEAEVALGNHVPAAFEWRPEAHLLKFIEGKLGNSTEVARSPLLVAARRDIVAAVGRRRAYFDAMVAQQLKWKREREAREAPGEVEETVVDERSTLPIEGLESHEMTAAEVAESKVIPFPKPTRARSAKVA